MPSSDLPSSGLSRRRLLHLAGRTALTAGLAAPLLAACSSSSPAASTSTGTSAGRAGGSGDRDAIKIGVLFSLSGSLAIAETAMHNGALMAVDEINAAGGVNGRQLVPVVSDYASDFTLVVQKAKDLLSQGVAATVGCYSSASRKAVLPVFEGGGGILVYPTFYEGLECSTNVIYSSLVANQHLTDASNWMVENLGKKIYMVGSDYVGPQTYNAIVKEIVTGRGATVAENKFFPLSQTEFGPAIAAIQAAKPEVIWCTLVGDSIPAFYKQYYSAGLAPDSMPIMAGITTEQELAALSPQEAAGHYFPSSYFETMETGGNPSFVRRYQARYGTSQPTNMPVQASYNSVYLVKAAIEKAGRDQPGAILKAFPGVSVSAPGEGEVVVRPNHHTTHKIFLGKSNTRKLYDVIATFKPREPDPFPPGIVAAGHVPSCPRVESKAS
jgi:ABC-type branched-subunit amino acid transport system substrate-binding protein